MKNQIFDPQNMKKTTSKSCLVKQKFRRFRNFSFTAQQSKWQNSCSQNWPIEQLYIELGQIWSAFFKRFPHQVFGVKEYQKKYYEHLTPVFIPMYWNNARGNSNPSKAFLATMKIGQPIWPMQQQFLPSLSQKSHSGI